MASLTAASRVIVCGGLLACASSDLPTGLGPVPDGSLVTDATAYVAEPIAGAGQPVQYQFAVIARFENRSASPVYLGRCFPNSPQPMYSIIAADSSAIVSAYEPYWGCVAHNNQFEILPGAVRVDTFLVHGPNAFDEVKQQGIGVTNGVFRLFLFVGAAPGDVPPPAPGSLGISNAFIVRTAN